MAQRQVVKRITALIGLGLFAYLFVFFAQEAGKVAVWEEAATSQSAVQLLPAETHVFQHVDPNEYVGVIPTEGDTIVSLADSADSRARWNAYMDAPQKPGSLVPLEFTHDGVTHRTQVRLRTPTTAEFLLVSIMQSLRFLIVLLFMLVALWAFFARPDSAAVRALALFSFAMASVMIANVEVLSVRWATFHLPYESEVRNGLRIFALCFGAFWLSLSMRFPRTVRLMRDRPLWAYLLCYGPTALVVANAVYAQIFPPIHFAGTIVLSVLTAQIVAGVIILSIGRRHAEDRIQKRQVRLVLWGTGVGLASLVMITLLSNLFQPWLLANQSRALAVINVSFLALLLCPVSYAYAFGRYRLLEVEARLRRGTRYILAMGVALIVLALLAWAGSEFAREASTLGTVWGWAILSLVSLGLVTGARRTRRYIVDRLYPERRRMRDLFRDFLQSTYAMTDARTFWAELESHLQDGLMVDGVYPLMRKPENGAFVCRDSEHTPFHANSQLTARLERDRKPIMVDEAVASSRVHLTDEESDWLAQRKIAVVLPLLARSRLIGFLGLGMKTEQDDYAAEELRLLDSLAPQVALASENIRLLEENVDKKRLEEQLEMARRVQNGFLPRQIPYSKGLELAARCRFCLEVAGDYYDIIALPGGETVLAVGDVSGKGAGAALLMANLQASLRTAAGIGIPLTEIVSRINELIHRNTPPDQFITFFVAVFDPANSELTYVNAGHNPPLLLRRSGEIESLDVGGLILGTFTGIAYHQDTIKLSSGDLLLMYTDGVSEAMDAQDEEFGEERIRRIMRSHSTGTPEDAIEYIESAVLEHHDSNILEDDFTLLLARVL